jgi:hypothetical protein
MAGADDPGVAPIGGVDREDMMTRRSWMFGGGAVLTATAAVGVGVLVTSGAMAASDGGDGAATVSMITIGSDGEAYECTVDASVLPMPALPPGGLPEGAEAGAVVVTGDASASGATATAGASGTITVDGGGSVVWSTSDSLPAVEAVPVDPSSGLPMPIGGVGAPMGQGVIVSQSVGGDTQAMTIDADGAMTPVEVRQGTAEECAAAARPPAPPTDGG